MRIQTENFSNGYYIQSEGNLFKVSELDYANHGVANDDSKVTSTMPGFPEFRILADREPVNFGFALSDDTKGACSYTNLYVKVDQDKFFQIGDITDSFENANDSMWGNIDLAIIDSTVMEGLKNQFHFLASIEPAKLIR